MNISKRRAQINVFFRNYSQTRGWGSYFFETMHCAALRAADLDWIVGPGYSSGWYILGCSQSLASCLWYSARIGPDHTVPEQELNISKKVTTIETFYLR